MPTVFSNLKDIIDLPGSTYRVLTYSGTYDYVLKARLGGLIAKRYVLAVFV